MQDDDTMRRNENVPTRMRLSMSLTMIANFEHYRQLASHGYARDLAFHQRDLIYMNRVIARITNDANEFNCAVYVAEEQADAAECECIKAILRKREFAACDKVAA
jgi:hypothetical protein